jgi:predicted acyltransferase
MRRPAFIGRCFCREKKLLDGRKSELFWDAENILSTIPAVATCLLGVFAGLWLLNSSVTDRQKVAWLVGCGISAALRGWLWGWQCPVIKRIWTSSFVLVAGGYSAIFLGVFYLIIDVWKKQLWCQPFVWIGMNSITLYLVENILGGFDAVGARLTGGSAKVFFDTHVASGFGQLMISIVGLSLALWLARFLYQRKVFIRL